MPNAAIILVDDDPAILELQASVLRRKGLACETYSDPLAAWARIERGPVRVVVTDWEMPGLSGMDLLFKISGLRRRPHVILLTAHGSVDRAVQAMSEGAYSFLEKPFDPEHYLDVLGKALAGAHVRRAPVQEGSGAPPGAPSSVLIAESPAMKRVLEVARAAAATGSAVLLLGASGTGKEVLADYIHRQGQRARGPLVKVNCGALPEHLMESELFGHEKGAFTGADRRRIGRFEQADGGTLFLDEIGDLLPTLQVKLLRALQDGRIERVGSGAPTKVDFRLICATHRDLKGAVERGDFREDLYYRINVVPIRLPPLRERPGEIEPLALHFLGVLKAKTGKDLRGFRPEALACLARHAWPGNIRQLRNAIEYALVLCEGGWIRPCDLPEEVREARGASLPASSPPPAFREGPPVAGPSVRAGESGLLEERLKALEERSIRAALEQHLWNVSAAGKELGISRSALYEKMKSYGIRRPVADL